MDVSSGATAAAKARARRRVQRKDTETVPAVETNDLSSSSSASRASFSTGPSNNNASAINPTSVPSTVSNLPVIPVKNNTIISTNPSTQSALVVPRTSTLPNTTTNQTTTTNAPSSNLLPASSSSSSTAAASRLLASNAIAAMTSSLPPPRSSVSESSTVVTPSMVPVPHEVDVRKHPEFRSARRALAKARWRAAIAYVRRLVQRTNDLRNKESNHARWRTTLDQATKYQSALRRRKEEISRLKAENASTVAKLSNQLAEQASALALAQKSSHERMTQSEASAAAEKERLLATKEKEKAELLAVTEQERINLLATKESERVALETEAVETITVQAQMAAEATTQLQLALAFTQEQLQMTVNQVYFMDEEIRKLRISLDEANARGNEATAEAQAYHEQLLHLVETQKKREEEIEQERKEYMEHVNQQLTELQKQRVRKTNDDDDDGDTDEYSVKGLRNKLTELRELLNAAEAGAVANSHALAQRNAAFTEASNAWAIERSNYEVQLGSGNYKLCLTQAMNDVRESVYQIVGIANDPGLVAPPPPMGDINTLAPSDLLHDIQSGSAFFATAMQRILKRNQTTETNLAARENNLREAKKEIEILSSQIQDMNFELLSQKQNLNQQIDEETQAHQMTRTRFEQLRKEEEDLRKQLKDTQTTLTEINNRNELLSVQLGAAQSAHSDCGNRIQTLEKARDTLEAARDTLAENFQTTRDSLTDAKHTLELNLTSTQTKLTSVEAELSSTQKLLQIRQEEIQDLNSQLQGISNELNDTKVAHKDATELGSRTVDAHAAEVQRAAKLEATITELSSNLLSLRTTHEQIVNSLSAAQNDNVHLQTKLDTKEHDIGNLKQEIQQFKDRVSTLTMELEGARREIMTSDASLAATNMELSNTQEKVVNVTNARDQYQQLYQNTETERKANEAIISELRINISTLENQLSVLRNEYDAYRHDNAEIVTLREKTEQAINDTVQAKEVIKSVTKEKDDIHAELQRTVGELNAANTTIKSLRVEIGEVQTKVGAANHASELALSQLSTKQDTERKAWNEELAKVNNSLSHKTQEYDTATHRIQDLLAKVTELEAVHGEIRIAQKKAELLIQEANTKAQKVQEETNKAAQEVKNSRDQILREAESTADMVRQKSTAEADTLMQKTKADVERLYTVAQTEVSATLTEMATKVEDTQKEAEAILAKANTEALAIRTKAEENAQGIVTASQEILDEAKQRAAATQRAAMAAADRVIDLAEKQAGELRKKAKEALTEAQIERSRIVGDAETEAVSVRKQANYLLQQTALDIQESVTGSKDAKINTDNTIKDKTTSTASISRTISFMDSPRNKTTAGVTTPKPNATTTGSKVSSSTAVVAQSNDPRILQANEEVQKMLREAEEAAEAIVMRAKKDSMAMREEAVNYANELATKAKLSGTPNTPVSLLVGSSSSIATTTTVQLPVVAAAAAITASDSSTTSVSSSTVASNEISTTKATVVEMLRQAQTDKEALIRSAEQAAKAIQEEAERVASALLQRTAAEVDSMLQRARDRVRAIEQEGFKARHQPHTPSSTGTKSSTSSSSSSSSPLADREVARKLDEARAEAEKLISTARTQAATIVRTAKLQADSIISNTVTSHSKILATMETE